MNRIAIRVSVLAALLASCGPSPTAQPPLAGAAIGGPFVLTDQNGRTVRDTDFRGRYRIVYFGYSYCPDVCPLDLQNIGAAMKKLDQSDPALSAKVVPIFITVDPERDTPAVLRQYVANFYPRMLGLGGSAETTARVAKEFAVFYQKQPSGDSYLVNHSRAAYLMGPSGEPIALLPADQSADAVAAELKKWVR